MFQDPSVISPEIRQIALDDLSIPPWNPRPFINPVELDDLVTFLEKGGIVPRIWVWKDPSAKTLLVISGQRRVAAYRQWGKTYIEAEILDIPLQKAKFLAVSSNKDDKPHWLGEFIAVENLQKENPDLKQKELASELGWSEFRVSLAVNLTELLTPAARTLIEQTAKAKISTANFEEAPEGNKPKNPVSWELTERVAARLIPLLTLKPIENAQHLAESTLKTVISQQLTGPQTKELVDSLLSGGDPAQFKPTPKTRKPRTSKAARPSSSTDSPLEPPSLTLVSKPTSPVSADEPATAAQSEIPPTPLAHPPAMGTTETLAWDTLAGLSIVSQIQAKIKKGQRPNLGEALILVLDFLWRCFVWVNKHVSKLAKLVGKTIWKWGKESGKILLKSLGRTVYNVVRVLLAIVFLGLAAWLAYDVFVNGLHIRTALHDIGLTLRDWIVLLWKYW